MIVLGVNFVLRNRRWLALAEMKSAGVTSEFLCWQDLPRVGRELLGAEAAAERIERETPSWRADCGWGQPGSEHEGVHFKRSVARSLWLVEEYATSRDASLAIGSSGEDATGLPRASGAVDAGEYFSRLRRAFPELSSETSRSYLAYYRAARTLGRELSVREYDEFVRVFTDIQRCISPNT